MDSDKISSMKREIHTQTNHWMTQLISSPKPDPAIVKRPMKRYHGPTLGTSQGTRTPMTPPQTKNVRVYGDIDGGITDVKRSSNSLFDSNSNDGFLTVIKTPEKGWSVNEEVTFKDGENEKEKETKEKDGEKEEGNSEEKVQKIDNAEEEDKREQGCEVTECEAKKKEEEQGEKKEGKGDEDLKEVKEEAEEDKREQGHEVTQYEVKKKEEEQGGKGEGKGDVDPKGVKEEVDGGRATEEKADDDGKKEIKRLKPEYIERFEKPSEQASKLRESWQK